MKNYFNKDMQDKVHAIYGGRQAGKTYYEMNKSLTNLSLDETNCIEGMKYIITNLKDEDLKTLVRILLGNRYKKFIDMVKEKENDKN